VAAPVALVPAATLTHGFSDRIDDAGLSEGPRRTLQGAASVSRTVRAEWQIERWKQDPARSELITLARYLNACTPPDARVFVQPYVPQVLGLARRPFAGGLADLRPGFFTTERDQQLILSRLRRQNVPVALLDADEALDNFRESFPLVAAFLDEQYDVAGRRLFDGRFGITLLVKKTARADGRFADLDWPCLA